MAENDYKTMNDEEIKKFAQRRYFIKSGFFYHLGVFLILSAVMVIIYLLTGRGYPWFVWPVGFWALFILGHIYGTKKSLNAIDGKPTAVDREAARLKDK